MRDLVPAVERAHTHGDFGAARGDELLRRDARRVPAARLRLRQQQREQQPRHRAPSVILKDASRGIWPDRASSSRAPGWPASSAARALEARGAARHRRRGARPRRRPRLDAARRRSPARQHAEAGADLIEDEQEHVLTLARELGLKPVRILRDGFGFYGPDARGRRRIHTGPARSRATRQDARRPRSRTSSWRRSAGTAPSPRDSAASRCATWLDGARRAARLQGRRCAAFADSSSPTPRISRCCRWSSSSPNPARPASDCIFRIPGGNDRLATGDRRSA